MKFKLGSYYLNDAEKQVIHICGMIASSHMHEEAFIGDVYHKSHHVHIANYSLETFTMGKFETDKLKEITFDEYKQIDWV